MLKSVRSATAYGGDRIPLLGRRFRDDGVATRRMNSIQREARAHVREKVRAGVYTLETPECAVCSGADFQPLSEKDRYGLSVRICICRKCGLIQTVPRMTAASYAQFYEEEYRRLYLGADGPTAAYVEARSEGGHQIHQHLLSVVPELFDAGPALTVLEIGCGAGGILKYFREMGHREVGVDLGKQYVEFGRDRYGLQLYVGDIDAVPSGIAPDLVIFSHVLEHLLDPRRDLERVREMMAPGGVLYIEVPGVRNLQAGYANDWLQYAQNAHTYHFSLTSLKNLVESVGFELVCGDEQIRSVFRAAASRARTVFVSDYAPSVHHLRTTEAYRRKTRPLTLAIAASKSAYSRLRRVPVIGAASERVVRGVKPLFSRRSGLR